MVCMVHVACLADKDTVSNVPSFTRTEDFTPIEIGPRKRHAKGTLLFAEFQVKYGMFQNYLHYWIDRPLFWNRAMRPAKFAYETPESFAIHVREARNAGLDGFNLFTGKSGLPRIKEFNRWLGEAGVRDFSILPTLGYGDDGRRTAAPDIFLDTIALAQKDPSFPRIDGRPLVPTYSYRMFKPHEHRLMIGEMERKLGKDSFLICGDIDNSVAVRLQKAYASKGSLSREETAELERAIEEVLDVAGGLQMRADELKRPYDGQYCCVYDLSFFDNCTVPALERILARPEYSGKVVGFYVQQGYINHLSGNDNSEDCTETLRRFLRSVARINPDYLLFFEWNEVNENTMFQPTVWGGRTAPRILRWHSRMFKGLPPDPFPGDDTSVPPLALSYRAVLKPGEEFRIELLDIPDGTFTDSMTVRLTLSDIDGRVVLCLPTEHLAPSRFGAITYLVDSKSLPGGTVLVPALEVDGRRYDGFSPIRVDPTVSINYKTVRQCLRDMLVPSRTDIAVAKRQNGRYAFSCTGDFREPLASVELICNEDEQSAAGAENEYDASSNHIFSVTMNIPPPNSDWGWLSVSVPGVKGCSLLPKCLANVNPGVPVSNAAGDGFRVQALCWSSLVTYFLQIPRTAPPETIVEIEREGRPGFRKLSVPLKVLLEKGIAGAVLDEAKTSMRVDVRRVFNLPDLPPHLKTYTVDWNGTAETHVRFPVFHFRAISESGRIWRSRPFRPDAIPAGDTVLPIYDEYAKKPSHLITPKALVPEISYDFDPASGAAMANSWDPFFDAQLGGGTYYCEPFNDTRIKVSPGGRAPEWVKDEGRWCLAFDGVNDYVNFPREAFPQAPFTLEMEIKPDCTTNAPMTLFRHFDFIRGSISLFIVDGRLQATWGDRDLSREPRIVTGLELANGKWHDVSVSYDLEKFVFTVDGRTFTYPWTGRPFRFKPSVFGGHDKQEMSPAGGRKPVYYKGLLRKILFRHSPVQLTDKGI